MDFHVKFLLYGLHVACALFLSNFVLSCLLESVRAKVVPETSDVMLIFGIVTLISYCSSRKLRFSKPDYVHISRYCDCWIIHVWIMTHLRTKTLKMNQNARQKNPNSR